MEKKTPTYANGLDTLVFFAVKTISIRYVKIGLCVRFATDGATRHVLVARLAQANLFATFAIK